MQKVLTAAEMREVDRRTTEEYGIPSIILMENAAHAVARVITEKLGGSVKGKSILILCGKGNNGGDGAALARILWTQGAFVSVELHAELTESTGDAKINFDILESLRSRNHGRLDGMFFSHSSPLIYKNWINTTGFELYKFDVLVDALFGTGISRPLDENYAYLTHFRSLKDYYKMGKPLILSVDLPSGLQSDLGSTDGPSVYADVTVTFTAPKPANILPEGSSLSGELIVADIGSPIQLVDSQPSQLFLANRSDAGKWLNESKIANSSYKNKRGHVLLIAGSDDYSGAAVLAGNAAMRSGVGLVTVVTPASSKDSAAARALPEVMVRGVAETDGGAIADGAFEEIADLREKADAVAVGCGLSQNESTKTFVEKLIANRTQPTIVDADALNLLSPFAGGAAKGESDATLILTPHEGEFMRLLGTDDKDVIKDRVAAVRDFSQKHNVILVLKGERVLIGEPGGKVVVNPTGNSGLGKAGNGDTLTGVLAGFAAQAAAMEIDIFETVVAAVYIAGLAGDIAEKRYGKRVMTASDVRECLTEAFAQCEV